MDTIEFFEHVLADEGYYCSVGIKKDQRPITAFHATKEALAEAVLSLFDSGYDAYHACATFSDKSRKAANALFMKSSFLDIDCGEGKQYATQEEGLEALLVFCQMRGFPTPSLIDSGYGLHAYWAYTQALPAVEWKAIAERLKQICAEDGLKADAAITADLSRILRSPGTANLKYGKVAPVTTILKSMLVDPKAFKELLGVSILSAPAPEHIGTGVSPLMKELRKDRLNRFATIMDRATRSDGCAQLDYIVNNQKLADYNQWRAGLSIARNCEDWETAVHEISKDHPGYDYGRTLEKCEDLIDKPYKCVTIESLRPKGCDGCPHKGKITSPIVLGLEIVKSTEEVIVGIQDDGAVAEFNIPALPYPYFRANSGAIYCKGIKDDKEGDDDEKDLLVYEHTLYLIKRMQDSSRGDLVLARLHLPREKVREFVIPVATLTSKDELRKILSANGVITAGKPLEKIMWYLIACAKHDQKLLDIEVLYNQFGWADHDSKFILGTQELTPTDTRYSPPSEATGALAAFIRPVGDLNTWKRASEVYTRPGAEPHAFAFFGSFGAPLIKFTGYDGAMVSLVNMDSGTGKTTLLKMINSVWGHPSKLMATESDTTAHKIHRLGIMNNLPYTCDEMTNMQGDVASKLAYAFTQGVGPGRMQAQTNAERKNDTTWATLAFCTSNASIIDKIAMDKAAANGEIMRIIEYKIEPVKGLSKQEAYSLFEGILPRNHGIAGGIYIQHVMQNLDSVITRVLETQERIDTLAKLESKYRFYSADIAAHMVGGTISGELALHNISPDWVMDWVLQRLIPDMQRNLAQATSGYTDVLGDFMNQNIDNVLTINSEVDKRSLRSEGVTPFAMQLPRRQLIIRIEPDLKHVYVVAKEFKEFCTKKQIMYKEFLRGLEASGAYMGETKKRMGKGTSLDYPAVQVYQFDCSKGDYFGLDDIFPVAPQEGG
jgi:hypothetical protein